jgi:hypothetical protein
MAQRFVSRARALTALLVAGTLTTCARDAAGPGRRVALAVEAVLPSSLELAAFNLAIDNIRLIVVRPPADTVFNSTFPFLPSLDSLQLSAEVTLEQSPETFQVTIQLLSGTTLLFSGTQDVTLSSEANNPPAQVPVTYSGPGQNVATLIIGPLDSVLTQGAALQFRASALDAQSNPVANFYLSWTTSDPVAVPIDATGRLVAPPARRTVTVSARTPNNVSATTPITFAPVATALSIVSGCGQIGPVLTQLPQPIVAKVIAGDGLGVEGVVVTFTAPAGASVATAQVVTDAAGLAQTLVTPGSTSGAVVFQVSAPGLGTVPSSQSAFGIATQLAFVTQPTTTTVGSTIVPALVVAARDAQGILVPTFTGDITIALGNNPGSAILSGNTTVPAVGGLATFSNLSLDNVGTGYTLLASAAGLTGATSAAFNVGSGTATQLAFTVHPATTTAGSPIVPPVQVVAQDALGNTVSTFIGNVTLSINTGPPGAALTGTPSIAAVAGTAVFANLVLDSVGTYTLLAVATGTSSATSLPFGVTVGLARRFVFTVQPSDVTAGLPIVPPVVVTVQDLQGNTDASFTGSVSVGFATNPGVGVLSGTLNALAVAGVATFADLSIDKAGIGYTLQATGTGVTTGVSNPFTVSAGAATFLTFVVPPTTVGVDAPITPPVVVAVVDDFGNLVPTATDDVTIAINANPGNATLGGTATQAAVAGFATFADLSLDQPGTGYSFVANAPGLSTGISPTFDVIAGATQFLVSVTPSVVTAGTAVDVDVTAQDGLGNTVTGYVGTIFLSSTDPQATLPSPYTFSAGENGTHSFVGGVTLRTAGGHFVSATDQADPRITGFGLVSVDAASAAQLAFMVQPTTVVQNLTMTPAVEVAVEDAFGNTVVTTTASVTIAIDNNPGSANLGGVGTQPAISGVATFSDLTLDQPGTGYTLNATVSGLPVVVSNPFNVLSTGALITWTGAVSTDWFDPGNWSPSGVPVAGDNVRILPAANQPVLTTNVSVQDLSVDVSATLSTNGFALTATRNVDAAGFVFGPGTVALNGSGTTVQGYLPSVVVNGSVTAVNSVTASGNLDVVGAGSFDLGTSSFVSVNGSFSTSGTATIQMNNGSFLFVTGDAAFGGGSEAGKLSDGTIEVLGSFTQSGDPESFATSGFFFVALFGTGPQTVQFANPGTAAGTSHFSDLHLINTGGGVSLASDVFVLGQFGTSSGQGALNKIFGNGNTLTTKGLFVDSLVIDNMPLVVDSSTTQFIGFLDNVVFQNFPATAIQLDVTRTLGTVTFNNLQFLGTPPTPGFHLRANDPVAGNGRFTIAMVNPTPISSGARFAITGEALINWP